MRRCILLLAVVALAAGVAAVASAADRGVALDVDHQVIEFDGARASGANIVYVPEAYAPCTKEPQAYCDDTLIHVTVPAGAEHSTLSISGIGNGKDDFDAYLYESDADGNPGTFVDFSNNEGTGAEEVSAPEPKSDYYLLRVVYFAVDDASYHATARLFLPDRFTPTPTPTPSATASSSPTPEATATSPAGASPTPEAAPAQRPAASPAPAPVPQLRLLRRTRRAVTVRVTCPDACRAVLRAGRARRSVVVDAGDTREIALRARRPKRVTAVITPRRGGAPVYLTRTLGPASPPKRTR